MKDLRRYSPTNHFSWWQSALAAVPLAMIGGLVAQWMYDSRLQAVPGSYVLLLGLIYWIALFLIAGVDSRLPPQTRGQLSLLGVGVGVLGAIAAGLGVVLY